MSTPVPGDETSAMHAAINLRRQAVLLVEDDDGQAETLSALLGEEGFDVTVTRTGAAAIAAATATSFAVAVVDLRLPDRVGTEFVTELRELDPRIRIVMHTGYSTLDSAVESLNLGVFAYLQKGDAPQALITTVQRAAYAYLDAALRDSQDKLERIANHSPQLISYVDASERFRFMNERYADWYGQSVATMLGRAVREVLSPERYAIVAPYLKLAFSGSDVTFSETLDYADGQRRAVAVSYTPDIDDEGNVRGIFCSVTDETGRRAAEQALLDSEATFRAMFEQSVFGICMLDSDGSITSSNRALQDMLGYDGEALLGMQLDEVLVPADSETTTRQTGEMLAGNRAHLQFEAHLQRSDGDTAWANTAMSAVRDGAGTLLFRVAMIEDITEAKQLSEQLNYQATHDALTGLVNRREFESRLNRVVESMAPESEHALCYVDLDQFKLINDTCGHIAGDALLRQLGGLLPATVRKRDTLARLGGDEFGLLMEHCPLGQAERVANSIRSTIASFRFFWEERSFSVGASIGLVPITGGDASAAEVMKAADTACYAAKEGGRNRVRVFRADDTTMRERSTEMQWAARLGEALERDRFELHVQPIATLNDRQGGGTCMEVFVRLRDVNGDLVQPGAFLPSAERYGLATRIDTWVVQRVLRWMAADPGRAAGIESVGINLSAQTIADATFPDTLEALLNRHRVAPEKLCFEIAESNAMVNLSQTQQFIRRLSAMGAHVALDDFGTGLASFAYLKNLPVDFIKIDGTLVRDVLDDKVVYTMVRSINEIAQVMGKTTVAEFVESEQLREALKAMGIDHAQGFAIDEPRPLLDSAESSPPAMP